MNPKFLSTPNIAGKQTSIGLTQTMREQVEYLATAQYGRRGMARWIEESLREFIKVPDFIVRVGAGEANLVGTKSKSIRLTARSEDMLSDAITRVRTVAPMAENVRSQILRGAFAHAISRVGQADLAAQMDHSKLRPVDDVLVSDKPPSIRRRSGS